MKLTKIVSIKTGVLLFVSLLIIILIIIISVVSFFLSNYRLSLLDVYYIPQAIWCGGMESGRHKGITDMAIITTNISRCEGECAKYWTWLCYSYFAANVSNVSICNEIPHPFYRDECFYSYSLNRSSLSACLEVKDKDSKYDCSAKILENTTICMKIQYNWTGWECVEWIGIKRNDTKICDEIERDYLKARCYYKVGINTFNISICDEIKDFFWADFCYKDISLDNHTVCNKIQTGWIKDSCYGNL